MGEGSDGESAGSGEARPLFRTTRPQGVKRGVGTRSKRTGRTIEAAVEAALNNLNESSDDDALPRTRRVARFRQRAQGDGADGSQPKRAKQTPEKAGSIALAKHYDSLLEEEIGPSTETPSVEETSEYLEYLEKLAAGEDVKPPKGKGRGRGKGKRRVVKQGEYEKTHVRKKEEVTPEKPEEDDEEDTPLKEARLRHTGAAFKGGGKKASRKGGGGSDSEEEESKGPSQDRIQAWEADFDARIDKKLKNPTTAFSIKRCSVQQIRQLDGTSYLGGEKHGGKMIFDDEKKVNLHFLLGTHKELDKIRKRRKQGEQVSEDLGEDDQHYLRWLVVKALKLRVINKTELRAGVVGINRMKKIQKSNRWSLALPANLAELSDDDGGEEVSPELKFKGRERPEDTKENTKEVRRNLRAQIESRMANVSVSASHNVDLEEMHDLLTAPSFSFDWSEKQLEDEDEGSLLEVDIPEEEKLVSKRDIFFSQLHRARSFHQARGLTHANRTKSNSSLGSNPADGTAATSQEQLRRAETAPDLMFASAKERSEPGKPPVSSLWERLEAKKEAATSSQEHPTNTVELSNEGEIRNDDINLAETSCQPEDIEKGACSEPAEGGLLEQNEPSTKLAEVSSDAKPLEIQSADVNSVEAAQGVQIETCKSSESSSKDKDEIAESVTSPAVKLQLRSDAPEIESTSKMEVATDANLDTTEIGEACKDSEMQEQSRPETMSSSEKHVASEMLSEDWHGITPTAMWAVSPLGSPIDSFDSTMDAPPKPGTISKADKEHNLEISPTLPMLAGGDHQLEISPTLPMVTKKDNEFEISPTMPMIPMEESKLRELENGVGGLPNKERELEISPTLPMIPSKPTEERNLEISQTQPMVPGADHQLKVRPPAPMCAKKDHEFEISPTMPMIPMEGSNLRESEDGAGGLPNKARQLEISPTLPMIPNKSEEDLQKEPIGELLAHDRSEFDSLPTASRNGAPNIHQDNLAAGHGDKLNMQFRERLLQPSASIMSDDSLSESEGEDIAFGSDQLELQQNPEQRRREREWLRHKRKLARQEMQDTMAKKRKRKVTDTQAVLPTAGKDTQDDSDVFGGYAGGPRRKKTFLSK